MAASLLYHNVTPSEMLTIFSYKQTEGDSSNGEICDYPSD